MLPFYRSKAGVPSDYSGSSQVSSCPDPASYNQNPDVYIHPEEKEDMFSMCDDTRDKHTSDAVQNTAKHSSDRDYVIPRKSPMSVGNMSGLTNHEDIEKVLTNGNIETQKSSFYIEQTPPNKELLSSNVYPTPENAQDSPNDKFQSDISISPSPNTAEFKSEMLNSGVLDEILNGENSQETSIMAENYFDNSGLPSRSSSLCVNTEDEEQIQQSPSTKDYGFKQEYYNLSNTPTDDVIVDQVMNNSIIDTLPPSSMSKTASGSLNNADSSTSSPSVTNTTKTSDSSTSSPSVTNTTKTSDSSTSSPSVTNATKTSTVKKVSKSRAKKQRLKPNLSPSNKAAVAAEISSARAVNIEQTGSRLHNSKGRLSMPDLRSALTSHAVQRLGTIDAHSENDVSGLGRDIVSGNVDETSSLVNSPSVGNSLGARSGWSSSFDLEAMDMIQALPDQVDGHTEHRVPGRGKGNINYLQNWRIFSSIFI